MQIPIKLARPGQLPEWCFIELQGTLEMDDLNATDLQRSIGDLFFTKQGEPILIIGHHELRGKEVKLDKPILILQKRRAAEGQGTQGQVENEKATVTYEVEAVAKHKILFKSRPKPIVSKGAANS